MTSTASSPCCPRRPCETASTGFVDFLLSMSAAQSAAPMDVVTARQPSVVSAAAKPLTAEEDGHDRDEV